MHPQSNQHSAAWVGFTYVSFAASLLMVFGGIVMLPVGVWVQAYFAMGVLLLVQACIILTKTIRDQHESQRLVNRLDDAKAERLLMEVERGIG